MRCSQCGFEAVAGAAFCSRCGTRLFTPRPADRREYALTRILPSWWHFVRGLVMAGVLLVAGFAVFFSGASGGPASGAVLAGAGLIVLGVTAMTRRATNWSITSERLIERRGLLTSRRRELELADIRSVEVDRRLMQRILRLGNVAVATAASDDAVIRLEDVADPEMVAEIVRQARAKRLV
jgi:uncharacterized membrane protein YdbT with pleckstrin-like domain